MYRLKERWKPEISMDARNLLIMRGLDIDGVYPLDAWRACRFDIRFLEKVN